MCSRSGELSSGQRLSITVWSTDLRQSVGDLSYSHQRQGSSNEKRSKHAVQSAKGCSFEKMCLMLPLVPFCAVFWWPGVTDGTTMKIKCNTAPAPSCERSKAPKTHSWPHSTANSTAFLHACSVTLSPLLCFVFSKEKDKWSCLPSNRFIHRLHLYRIYLCGCPMVSLTLTQS